MAEENEMGIPEDVADLFRGEVPDDDVDSGEPEGGGEAQEADSGEKAGEAQTSDSGGAAEPGEGEQKASQQQVDPRDEHIRRLEQQVSQMQGYLQRQVQQEKQTQGKEEGKEQDKLPEYNFDIPDAMVQAFNSGEPEQVRQGLKALVQGVGQTVHQQVRDEYQKKLDERSREIYQASVRHSTGSVEQRQQAQQFASGVFQDYYSKYPDHQNPAVRPLVQQVARNIAAQRGAKGWSAQLRDEIGQAVENYRKQMAGSPSQQKQNPPHQTSQGARPSGRRRSSEEDLIAQTFDW